MPLLSVFSVAATVGTSEVEEGYGVHVKVNWVGLGRHENSSQP